MSSLHGDVAEVWSKLAASAGLRSSSEHGDISGHSYPGIINPNRAISILDIILDPGDDEEFDASDYEETRLELRAAGHNLTSVLMNPRETPLEELFDEFQIDQSTPVTIQSIATSNVSMSSSSHHTTAAASSHHSINGKSSSLSRISPNWASNLMLAITKTEEDQLKTSVNKLHSVYRDYYRLRASNLFSPNIAKVASSTGSKLVITSTDDMFQCFREVPEPFFRPDFQLSSTEVFPVAMGVPHYRYTSRPPVNDDHSGSSMDNNTALSSSNRRGSVVPSNGSSNGEFLRRMSGLIPPHQQDKLTRYLDSIELGLLKHIWVKSSAFFNVLDDVRVLETLVIAVHRHISDMRRKLRSVSEHLSITSMRIPRLHHRQQNETLLYDKLQSMQRVLAGRAAIQAMLEAEDYLGALEMIAEVKQVYHEELEGIISMKKVGGQLDDYDHFICEVMCNRFVSIATQYDDSLLSDSSSSSSSSSSKPNNLSSDLPADVLSELGGDLGSDTAGSFEQLLRALMHVDRLKPALNMYKQRLSESVRLIVRTCVLEYLTSFDPTLVVDALDFTGSGQGGDSSESSSNTPFAQRVRAMSSENFLSCISMCFEHVLIALRRSNSVHKFVESTLARHVSDVPGKVQALYAPSPPPTIDPVESTTLPATGQDASATVGTGLTPIATAGSAATQAMIVLSKSCLTTACDLAQRSIAQLLSLRKDSASRMTVDKMKFLWETGVHFITSVEALIGTSVYVMRQALLGQTKVFLDQLHEGYKGKLVSTLDNERWIQCDVSSERQAELDRLVSGKSYIARQQPQQGTSTSASSSSSSSSNNTSTSASNSSLQQPAAASSAAVPPGEKKKEAHPVVIDGHSFNVVWSVLLLAEISMTYLDVAASFPSITTEVIVKSVELVRLFDTRSRQLVLGAQAIQSAARLKSISAKHLSITAQSVGLVSALLPHIRAALLSLLPPKHHLLLTEFDRVSHELIDHHNLIVAKFVSIVGDFVDASAGKLRLVDWDRFQGQCEYFEEVLKNVTALHRVVSSIVPPEQVQDIFSRIFSLLSRKMPTHFEEIMPATQTGRQRILDEVAHLVTSFSRLKQIDCKTATFALEEAFRKRYGGGLH